MTRGYETFMRALFEQARGRVPVTLFKGAGPDAPDERALGCLRRTALLGRALTALSSHRKAYDLEATTFARSLWRVVRAERLELVYVPDIQVARSLTKWRRRAALDHPLAIVLHNSAPFGVHKLGGFDLVQQVTGPAQDEAVAAGLTNTRLLPMPIDTERFAPGDRGALRAELGIPADAPLVLCAAAHQEFKRLDLLVDAVADLPAGAGPAPRLLIVGQDGPASRDLREQAARRLGGRAVLHALPPARMPEAYRAADVFALPSRKEGFGLVLAEAMASGLPIVTHDDAVRRWILGDDGGVLVDCDRPGALRDALARLLASPDERRRLAQAGRARVQEELSWQRLLPRYLELFQEARAAGAPRA
jgi:glycosyltransferase involved in cell wall biosynthesis